MQGGSLLWEEAELCGQHRAHRRERRVRMRVETARWSSREESPDHAADPQSTRAQEKAAGPPPQRQRHLGLGSPTASEAPGPPASASRAVEEFLCVALSRPGSW